MAGDEIMAELIKEPDPTKPKIDDWKDLLRKLTDTTRGLTLIDFENKNNLAVPIIKKGSIFDVNGSYYEVKNDEGMTNNFSSMQDGWVYIYAIPGPNKSTTFEFSNDEPVHDPTKGGH